MLVGFGESIHTVSPAPTAAFARAKKKPPRAFSYQGLRLALRFHFAARRCSGDPTGIRTRVHTVKGYCPRPLDDRVNTVLRDAIPLKIS